MSALRTELGDLKIVNEEQKSQLLVKDGELADMQAQKVKMQAEVDNLAAQLLRAHVDHGKPDYKPATTDVEPADQGGVWSSDSGTHRWVPDKIEIR